MAFASLSWTASTWPDGAGPEPSALWHWRSWCEGPTSPVCLAQLGLPCQTQFAKLLACRSRRASGLEICRVAAGPPPGEGVPENARTCRGDCSLGGADSRGANVGFWEHCMVESTGNADAMVPTLASFGCTNWPSRFSRLVVSGTSLPVSARWLRGVLVLDIGQWSWRWTWHRGQ